MWCEIGAPIHMLCVVLATLSSLQSYKCVCVFVCILSEILFSTSITVTTALPRLLDTPPYNELTLTCLSSTRVRLQPTSFNVTFTWFRAVNGMPMEEVVVESPATQYGSTVTSQLSVNVSEPGSHTYLCRASLDLRPAPDNRTMESTTSITIHGEWAG